MTNIEYTANEITIGFKSTNKINFKLSESEIEAGIYLRISGTEDKITISEYNENGNRICCLATIDPAGIDYVLYNNENSDIFYSNFNKTFGGLK